MVASSMTIDWDRYWDGISVAPTATPARADDDVSTFAFALPFASGLNLTVV